MRVSEGHEGERSDQAVRVKQFCLITGIGFALGSILVLICRIKLLQDISLLDTDSLYLIRDSLVEGRAYFFYLLPRRAFVFGILALLWWYGVGSLGLKFFCFTMGTEAGIWLQACLEQYRLKGILLWVFLYIPYIFFYLGALLLGFIICELRLDRYERSRLIREKPWVFLTVTALFLAGLYLESTVHPQWLKSFLKIF